MKVETLNALIGAEFYTGVPDSQLRALCDFLTEHYGNDPQRHIIGPNEGACAALAAGYHLSTGKVAVVYMQNSGEGNMVNPAASLLHRQIYGIPVLFLVGWRGEPGVPDEPQHRFQGQVTLDLLADLDIETFVIDSQTADAEVEAAMERFRLLFAQGKSAAFVIRKGALSYGGRPVYENTWQLSREDAIRRIAAISAQDPVVSTTGKASRELFELRAANHQSHKYDFLTVGSMGHASSIAFGIALQKPEARVWCIDGDGAALMHLGSLAVIGSTAPKNLIHVVINNGAHESVGGMITAAAKLSLAAIAKSCGYPNAVSVQDIPSLDRELLAARSRRQLSLIEVCCAIGARSDLGRPTTSTADNKREFMAHLNSL